MPQVSTITSATVGQWVPGDQKPGGAEEDTAGRMARNYGILCELVVGNV